MVIFNLTEGFLLIPLRAPGVPNAPLQPWEASGLGEVDFNIPKSSTVSLAAVLILEAMMCIQYWGVLKPFFQSCDPPRFPWVERETYSVLGPKRGLSRKLSINLN